MDQIHEYVGRDLEAMSFAVNYHEWILEIFKPFLGKRAVEVGAGSGSFSEMLLRCQLRSLAVVEPSTKMFSQLTARIDSLRTPADVSVYNATFGEVALEIKKSHHPDSIIYVNVLEHIEDDGHEITMIHDTLDASGRVFIFVPALPWLLSAFDEEIGHFRRYYKDELEAKCRRAGFRTLLCRYFDFSGILPWWVNYRLLNSKKMSGEAVKYYDRYVVPVAQAFESIVTPPIGKNLIVVAEK